MPDFMTLEAGIWILNTVATCVLAMLSIGTKYLWDSKQASIETKKDLAILCSGMSGLRDDFRELAAHSEAAHSHLHSRVTESNQSLGERVSALEARVTLLERQ